jgi:hypothetical protein
VKARARIVVQPGGKGHVTCPKRLQAIPNLVEGRRWDPDLRCWIVPWHAVHFLADAFRAVGCPTVVHNADEPYPTWADRVLSRVPPDAVAALCRELASVLADEPVKLADLAAARERARGW